MSLTLGIDQGSSSTKALLVSPSGSILWQERIAIDTTARESNKVEQRPEQILESVRTLIAHAQAFARDEDQFIAGIAFSTQRSGVCAFESNSGRAVSPLLTLRDRRAADRMQFSKIDKDEIERQSGLRCLPDYAASKIALLQDEHTDSGILVGTLDSYLLYNLLDQPVFIIEHTMAARTLLYSLLDGSWDSKLCDIFGVDMSRLPEIIASVPEQYSVQGIPVVAVLGDAQAALLNVLVTGRRAVLNMGTISSVSVATGNAPRILPGAACSVLYKTKHPEYLVEAITNASGGVVDLLKKELLQRSQKADIEAFDTVSYIPEACAYLPLHGTGSPHWHDRLPLACTHALQELTEQDLVAVFLYSIGAFVARNILWLQEAGILSADQPLAVTGGVARSAMLLQFIADVAGVQLELIESTEGSGRGVTFLPQVSRGILAPDSSQNGRVISPATSQAREYYQRWLNLEAAVLRGDYASFVLVSYE